MTGFVCVLLALCLFLITNPKPQFRPSAVFQLDLRPKGIEAISDEKSNNASMRNVSEEFGMKDFALTLNVKPNELESRLAQLYSWYTNEIVKSGGQLTGFVTGTTPRVFYQTDRNVGQFNMYTCLVNTSSVKVIAVIYECPR